MTTGTAIQLLLPGMETLVEKKPLCGKSVLTFEKVNLFGKWIEDATLRPCLREIGHVGKCDPQPRNPNQTSVDHHTIF